MSSGKLSHSSRRPLAVICGAALAAVWLSPSAARAGAPVIDNSHFRISYEHVEQDIGECLDVPFRIHHDGSSNARIQVRTRGTDGPQYFSLAYNTRDVYTNLQNGESFTARTSAREADTRITENADGTLLITGSVRETTTVHLPSGGLYGVDAGRVTRTVLLDLVDPQNPDDDVVISENLSDHAGVSRLGGFDLCTVAETLLG